MPIADQKVGSSNLSRRTINHKATGTFRSFCFFYSPRRFREIGREEISMVSLELQPIAEARLIKRLIKVGARVPYHGPRWYVHVASALPLARHYRAVFG